MLRSAIRYALLRAIRTAVQGLAGLAAAIPAVRALGDARDAAVVALWGAVGVGISGLISFFQNLTEALEDRANEGGKR